MQNSLAIDAMNEAKLNKNILENLKPRQERTEKDLVQVKFTGNNKDIVGNFKSVLKVWRIMKPVIIDLTSESLDDAKEQFLERAVGPECLPKPGDPGSHDLVLTQIQLLEDNVILGYVVSDCLK